MMTESDRHFERLVDTLVSHFTPSRQTRVDKEILIRLLYERRDCKETGYPSLAEAYAKRVKRVPEKAKLVRALRRAVQLLAAWIKERYDRNSDIPIRFELCVKDGTLSVTIYDGFKGRSISSLNIESRRAVHDATTFAKKIANLVDGKLPSEHVGQLSELELGLLEAAKTIRIVNSAVRRRM